MSLPSPEVGMSSCLGLIKGDSMHLSVWGPFETLWCKPQEPPVRGVWLMGCPS